MAPELLNEDSPAIGDRNSATAEAINRSDTVKDESVTASVLSVSRDSVAESADLVVALDTGPEILTGSTRLKAGSATKAVLNAMTTAAMVRLGKVFENLMVDLRPGSAKLADRALRIIEEAGGVSHEQAVRLHREAGGEVKTAIVMARSGVGAGTARRRLAEAAGRVRGAIDGEASGNARRTERPLD